MNGELLRLVDALHREKDIGKEITDTDEYSMDNSRLVVCDPFRSANYFNAVNEKLAAGIGFVSGGIAGFTTDKFIDHEPAWMVDTSCPADCYHCGAVVPICPAADGRRR